MSDYWDQFADAEDDQPKAGQNYWDQFANAHEELQAPQEPKGALEQVGDAFVDQLPMMGAMAGGMAMGLPGAALGGGTGKVGKNLINRYRGSEHAPKSELEYQMGPVIGAGEGLGMEMGGRLLGKVGESFAQSPYRKPVYDYLKDKVSGAANTALVKTGKVLHSMPEHFSERYLEQEGKLDARPINEIMDELVGYNTQKGADVSSAKDSLTGKTKNLENLLKDQKYQAGINRSDAKGEYARAEQGLKEELKGVSAQGVVPKIATAMENLKENIIVGSSESYEALGNYNGQISLKPFKDALRRGIDQLKFRGEGAVTPTDRAAIASLENSLQMIEEIGTDTVSGPEAKFIVQRFDQDTNYGLMTAEFDKIANQAKVNARSALNQSLRKIDGYAPIMDRVANQTRLLNRLYEGYGTLEGRISSVERLPSVKGKNVDLDLLDALELQTGEKIMPEVGRYIKAQDTLRTPSLFNARASQLPESKVLSKAQAESKRLANPQIRKLIEARTAPQKQALLKAEQEFEPYADMTEKGVEGKVKGLNYSRQYAPRKIFGRVDQVSGKNFSQEIEDRAVLDAFQKSDTNGARKTLAAQAIGKLVGGAFGYMFGKGAGSAIGMTGGQAIGAIAGSTLDKSSGYVLKKMMDGKISTALGVRYLEKQFGKYAPQIGAAAAKGSRALLFKFEELALEPEFQKIMGVSEEKK